MEPNVKWQTAGTVAGLDVEVRTKVETLLHEETAEFLIANDDACYRIAKNNLNSKLHFLTRYRGASVPILPVPIQSLPHPIGERSRNRSQALRISASVEMLIPPL